MDKNNSTTITENIKVKFTKIKSMRNHIKDKFSHIQTIKSQIRNNYIQYMNKESNDFFGLDSFHFQNKVLELEFSNNAKLYQFIDNRIYGDYYKLFVEIEMFLKSNLKHRQYDKIKELKNIEKYPIYKDLNNFTCYDFDTINNIHQDIIVIISCVKEIYNENEINIKEDMKQLNTGINIDNYIINNQYKNAVILTTNMKFENYLQVYHKYHYNLLHKFYEKLDLCLQHINHNPSDERFYQSVSEPSDTSSLNDHTDDILSDANVDYTPRRMNDATRRNSFLAPDKPEKIVEINTTDTDNEPEIVNEIMTVPEINAVIENEVVSENESVIENEVVTVVNENPEGEEKEEKHQQIEPEFQQVSNKKKKRNKKKNKGNN